MLLAAYNLVRFDHVSQLLNFRVLVPTKCRCCCALVDDAEFNLLAVESDETTVIEEENDLFLLCIKDGTLKN